MIRNHYFRLQRRHRHALCSDGGFPSQHPRRIAARDRRDERERRDTRNKGLRVARFSRWSHPSYSPEQPTEVDLVLQNLEGVRPESIEPLVSANQPAEPFSHLPRQ